MKLASIFTFALVALLSVSMTIAAPADKKKKGAPRGIFAKLDLTKEQQAKIKAISAETRAAVKAAGDDKDAKKAAGKAGRAKIMDVLTDTQKEKMKELAKAGKKKKDGDAPKKKKDNK